MDGPGEEKELALSTLIRRDRNDPGAVELLVSLLRDANYVVRKRAVSLADRFIHHDRTVEILSEVAGRSGEIPTVRCRAMEHLEMLFNDDAGVDGFSGPDSERLFYLERSLRQILVNPGEPLNVRGKALELAALFVRSGKLREWILYFHNRSEGYCKLSAITSMGRVQEGCWRNYILGYMESERMEYRCAAMEAMAAQEYGAEEPGETGDAEPGSSISDRRSGSTQ